MRYRSQVHLYKSLLRHPSQSSSKPTSPTPFNSLAPVSSLLTSSPISYSRPTSPHALSRFLDRPVPRNPESFRGIRSDSRNYATESSTELDVNKVIDEINLKFADAREEIEMAMESKETVYFDEEAECARVSVKEVLDTYEGLLAKLPESEKAAVQRSMGLKIEQLKAELKQLDD